MNKIKKYPIIHENQKYEIKWETRNWLPYISVYKVKTFLCFKFKKYLYSEEEHWVNGHIDTLFYEPDFYVEQAKYVFNSYLNYIQSKEHEKKRRQTQLTVLSNWDGIIDKETT